MKQIKPLPLGMGATMGVMMIWMIHSGSFGTLGLSFVLGHTAIIGVVLGVAFATARWRGVSFFDLTKRLHRPSGAHIAQMLGSAAIIGVLTCMMCVLGVVVMS